MKDYDPSPVCYPQRFYGRPSFPLAHPYAYGDTLLVPRDDVSWWRGSGDGNLIRFIQSDDRAVHYVHKFIQLQSSNVSWYHLIVRACVLDAFFAQLEAYIDPENPGAFLLEYSCWCDGGSLDREPLYRHHRHMILVARDGPHFLKNCWKLVPPFVPDGSRRYRSIQSWPHLKNVLFYVSIRKATCDLLAPAKHLPKVCDHYYIFKPLTPHFKLCVALTVEGGINELLTQRKRSLDVMTYARYCVPRAPSGYGVAIRHVLEEAKESLHAVVPVRKDFVPTGVRDGKPSSAYLVLPDGLYMHFERDEACAHLDDRAWAALQARKGNHFWESLKDCLWIPPASHQRILKEVMPLLQTMQTDLQRQEEASVREIAHREVFFLKVLKERTLYHETSRQHQKIFYQLRHEATKLYLEKLIDLYREREAELETQLHYYRQKWKATQVTLLDPSTSREEKVQSVSEERKKEKLEKERQVRVQDALYQRRLYWEKWKQRGEEGLEHLYRLLKRTEML